MKALEVSGLTKVYRGGVRAVDGISFSVDEGEVFGLLGPNGAGKTTTIKMITTLAAPTSGSISVCGVDALKEPQNVREMLGYVPQAISVDGDLTGYENLLIFSKLFHVEGHERRQRIASALEYMGLADRADDLVKHYSGGMMRRLEIAQVLVNRPRILFLDEPSIGLDPVSKRQVGGEIRRLNKEFGITMLITTHDMVEADELCQRIAIMNEGRIAVSGAPGELKASVGGDVVTVQYSSGEIHESASTEIGTMISNDNGVARFSTTSAERAVPRLMESLAAAGVRADAISLNRPTLDDVFMKYAKVSLDDGGGLSEMRSVRRSFVRHGR